MQFEHTAGHQLLDELVDLLGLLRLPPALRVDDVRRDAVPRAGRVGALLRNQADLDNHS